MATTSPIYQLDFKGHHSITHGALNSALTTVSAAVVAHLVLQSGFATGLQVALTMLSTTIIGLLMVLSWGAFASDANGGKVAHRSVALIGSGVWAALMGMSTWSAETVLQYGAVLVVATVVLGFVAWLSKPLSEVKGGDQAPDELELLEQAARDDLGAEWELRLRRVLNLECSIEGIKNYPQRTKDGELVGYTVEVVVPAGGAGWKTVSDQVGKLSNDMRLQPGCDVTCRMGVDRRTALIDVTVRDILCEDAPYPTEYKKSSIYDPLLLGVSRRNEPVGPILRERNCAIYGIGGSGKSNAGRVLAASLMQCTDQLTCTIDMTGLRLSMPMIQPYLDGRAENPGVFWVAYDQDEAYLMLRALNRMALARNNGYNQLKTDCDDDKMPCSSEYPAFMVLCDEVKYIAGNTALQNLYFEFKRIIDDHRDPGVRAIILALRGTDEIVKQAVQAQMHAIGVLKAASVTEYKCAFGTAIGDITPEDAPYPGCMQMRMDPAETINPLHVWRIKPQQLEQVTIETSGFRPKVDQISWLALNGRDASGQPFDDLEDGELDCCTTRWNRLRAFMGEAGMIEPENDDEIKKDRELREMNEDPIAKFNTIMDNLRTQASLVEGRSQLSRLTSDEIDEQVASIDIDQELAEIFKDFPAPMKLEEPTSVEVDNFALIYKIIQDAGEAGIGAAKIWSTLSDQGVEADRATIYKWLTIMVRPASKYHTMIERRSNSEGSRSGKWYAI